MSHEFTVPDDLRPHDLLWIAEAEESVREEAIPGWVRTSLRSMPVVVVRRAPRIDGLIPIGVRGSSRNQRFAATVPLACVTRRTPPERLVVQRCEPDRARYAAIPALRAFQFVSTALAGIDLAWGPTGSVGFELATGTPATTASSDLDLVFRAPRSVSRPTARAVLAALSDIDITADVQVETPAGCVALREYCATTSGQQILLRTHEGPRMVSDPWAPEPGERR